MSAAPARLRDFVKMRPETEGVLQHVGLDTWDLILVDVDGTWIREEFPSKDLAEAACSVLGVRHHDGWEDSRITRRMAARDHWGTPGGQRRAL
jgi:hypothetical protein